MIDTFEDVLDIRVNSVDDGKNTLFRYVELYSGTYPELHGAQPMPGIWKQAFRSEASDIYRSGISSIYIHPPTKKMNTGK